MRIWDEQNDMRSNMTSFYEKIQIKYTANILTVLSTAFGSTTCATVILMHILQPKIANNLKLYSSVSLPVAIAARLK